MQFHLTIALYWISISWTIVAANWNAFGINGKKIDCVHC
jgi:hypothetical protein